MASVDTLMLDSGSSVFYDDAFRNVLEDHMTYLRNHSSTQTVDVTPIQAHRYEFDLIGLLNELTIAPYLHWIVARMNHFNSFTHVPAEMTKLLIPDQKEISKLQQTHSTVNKIA